MESSPFIQPPPYQPPPYQVNYPNFVSIPYVHRIEEPTRESVQQNKRRAWKDFFCNRLKEYISQFHFSVHMITWIVSLLTGITLFITFIATVSQRHHFDGMPSISETGDYPPERYIFFFLYQYFQSFYSRGNKSK